FVWDADVPVLGVGGGTGVVPLVAMLRHARARGRTDLIRLVAAARSLADLPYGTEIADAGGLLTMSRNEFGTRPAGRLAASDLEPLVTGNARVLVCGSAPFAEAASRLLVDLGVPAADVRVERFGPTG